jgi:hypothetical protein
VPLNCEGPRAKQAKHSTHHVFAYHSLSSLLDKPTAAAPQNGQGSVVIVSLLS